MIDHDLTPEARDELGDLQPLYDRLATYDVPEPNPSRLLATLKPLLVQPREAEPVPVIVPRRFNWQSWLKLAWGQTALLETPFWGSSILLTLIGLAFGVANGSATTTLCLFFLSPLIAMGGVAYIFRPATRTLWELERLSHYQPFELLYARLFVILLLNIVLALALLLVIWTQGIQIVLWRLLLIWFGPMIGLMGVALFCSARWNMLVGIIVPMTLWSLMILVGWRESIFNLSLAPERIVTQMGTSNMPLVMALVALVGGILLMVESGGQVERWRS